MKKFSLTCAALLLATGLMTHTAAAQGSARIEDRVAIEDLMWRYVRALDSFNPEAYAAVFTEDGEFASGANPTKGREALREMVAGLAAGRNENSAPMHHMIVNSNLEFTGENTARFHSYWMTVFGPAGEAPLRVAAVGRGVDELERVDGEWLIKSRNVMPQD